MSEPGSLHFNRIDNDALLIELAGNWVLHKETDTGIDVEGEIRARLPVRTIGFDATRLTGWDSGLLIYLLRIFRFCAQNSIPTEEQGLPRGVRRLLKLALAVPEKEDARRASQRESLVSRAGRAALDSYRGTLEVLDFVGSSVLVLMKLFRGKARFRRVDLVLLLQDCGASGLPIVTLISMLVGIILAFVGAIQLRMFGAQIYVADLVGIAMTREMGAMMTGIIMAGRTGAAFAAQLGTMQVNQEIDAFKTLGISPMEFLVMPRVIALVLMMPLLCLYADFMGILGGFVVGVGMLDLSVMEYFNQTRHALTMNHFAVGIFKSAVFGVIVALSGCLRGMQCERSSSAVGLAATSAVVTAIVSIIVSDALFAVMTNKLGI
jgi:phospholipid/cholesterol/gamma-HCH transport system permease protein